MIIKTIVKIFLACSISVEAAISLEEHLWHSYQFNANHLNREEIFIKNVSSDDSFKINYKVKSWKSITVEKENFAAGVIENRNKIAVASIKVDLDKEKFNKTSSYAIDLDAKPLQVILFEHWNVTLKRAEVIAIVATEKKQLLWYRISQNEASKFWCWNINKDIIHMNFFEIEHNYNLLVITQYMNFSSADLYEFQIEKSHKIFWLRQKIFLQNPVDSSALTVFGPDYYLSIPQKSLDSLLIYKLSDNHFVPFLNITSPGVTSVVPFTTYHKSFIAFNGFNAGIYQFTRSGITRENIREIAFESVQYWLPILLPELDEIILFAQLSLDHGLHKTFIIKILTYNGVKFEEHEDVRCLYYGEANLGLSCLPGEESENGIKGAAAFSIRDVLGILIPRKNHESEMFIVKSEKRRVENPVAKEVEELKERQKYLQILIDSQVEEINKLKNNTEKKEEVVAIARDSSDLNTLKVKLDEMERDVQEVKDKMQIIKKHEEMPHYKKIIINGPAEISKARFKEIVTEKIRDKSADAMLNDIFLKNSADHKISGAKTFTNLQTDSLYFSKLNDIDASDIIFEDGRREEIKIDGDLILDQPLIVINSAEVERVNYLIFEKEVIELNRELIEDALAFENIEVLGPLNVDNVFNARAKRQILEREPDWNNAEFETFVVSNNIIAGLVNGEDFGSFLNQLCLRNINTYIPGTIQIEGDVNLKGDLKTEFLNDIQFPSDFVFSQNSKPNITGRKIFANSLIISEIYSEGTINGIDTSEIITLNTDQKIDGDITFEELEVGESLVVDGDIIGKHPSKFLSNPTLDEADLIKSNIDFNNLEVEGSIVIKNNLNRHNFNVLLSDKIYQDEDEAVISSIKQFPEGFIVRKNLELKSNSINDINIDSIMTKNSDQELNISTINGIVTFNSVEIKGLYDGLDIKKIDQEIVKLDGQQFISSTLFFDKELIVNNLKIVETLNDLQEDQISKSHRPIFDIDERISVDDDYDLIEVHGNFVGQIDGFDIKDFDERRLSLSKDQSISGNFEVDELSVENLSSTKINDIKYGEIDKTDILHSIKKRLEAGQIDIKDLYVNGSLEVDEINGIKAYYLGNSMFEGSGKKLNLSAISVRNVIFDDIKIQNLSSVGFQRWLDLLVFKNDSDIKISGDKAFLEGFTVEKLIEADKINDIPLDQILTKYGDQEISGPIIIKGNVSFAEDLEVDVLNNIEMDIMKENYEVTGDQCKVKGDIVFSRLAHINNLQIAGSVDDNDQTAQEFLENLIYKDADLKLPGLTIFKDRVNILGNLRVVDLINGVNLPAFASNIALTTKDAQIKAPVKFTGPVIINVRLNIDGNLKTKTLNQVQPQSWIDKAIFIDRGLLKGNFTFESVTVQDDINTKFINEIDVDTLIPLRTKQNFSAMTFDFGLVRSFGDIRVGNSTNFYNLPEENSNTVMINNKQEINSDITFSTAVLIDGNIELAGLLNEKDTKKIVTTNTDQTLSALYDFRSKTTLDQNLDVEGLINGINITSWLLNGVKISTSESQNINHIWTIKEDLVFEEDLNGNSLINGIEFHKFKQQLDEKRHQKYLAEKGFVEDYKEMCRDLTFMHEKMKKQIYKFDYFEYLQLINFENEISFVHEFHYFNNFYILIGEKDACDSFLMLFVNSHFEAMSFIPLGAVSDIISVYNNDLLYLVVKSHKNDTLKCKISGTNIWKFNSDTFDLVLSVEDQNILQESLIPGTFYGIKDHIISEFRLIPDPLLSLQKYRKWEVHDDNMAFVPRGLATGLALRTGFKLIKLERIDPIIEDDSSFDTEIVIRGNITEHFNTFLPGRKDSDLVVLRVGVKSSRRSLLAVASHEETSVRGSLDFIKIYEDINSGKMFQKIPSYKPSSLISIEFKNGETFLAFLENESILKVYEYRGVEGFKEKISTKIEGSQIFAMTIPLYPFKTEKKLIGLINKNRVTFIEAIMLGNQVEEDLKCVL